MPLTFETASLKSYIILYVSSLIIICSFPIPMYSYLYCFISSQRYVFYFNANLFSIEKRVNQYVKERFCLN
jgi:hypothetical protein